MAEKQPRKNKKKKMGGKRVIRISLLLVLIALMCYGAFRVVFGKVRIEQAPVLADGKAGEDDEFSLPISETRKSDYYTFLVCGLDQDKSRTDTIIVAAYDGKNQQINMLNIPRDTISDCERSIKKINSAFGSGIEQTKEEIQNLLGIPIDRYIVVDFKGFAQLVEAIGGVDFDVPVNMNYDDPYQDLHIHLEKGMQHLNGEDALRLVRFRKANRGSGGGYEEGDLGRIA
ncbi:MAG: LCP family protein, partial [Angelakisella sp.]